MGNLPGSESARAPHGRSNPYPNRHRSGEPGPDHSGRVGCSWTKGGGEVPSKSAKPSSRLAELHRGTYTGLAGPANSPPRAVHFRFRVYQCITDVARAQS